MSTARGLRNNNPGNIDYNSKNQWLGQLPHVPAIEARFCRFDRPENGIRALAKTLLTYQRKHGLKTVLAIISRWAPSSENNTAAYVRVVEAKTGTASGAEVDLTQLATLIGFVKAIMHHENGGYPYEESVIEASVRRALA